MKTAIHPPPLTRAQRRHQSAAAHRQLIAAYQQLLALGWQRPQFAPTGTPLDLIELGSSTIHRGRQTQHHGFLGADGSSRITPVLFREAERG